MESNKEEQITTVSEENIYKLNGRVPLRKAIPFGLQHVLAMFVSNLAPVLIVCSAAVLRSNGAHLSSAEITQLLQCAMFVAGIGTCFLSASVLLPERLLLRYNSYCSPERRPNSFPFT